MNAITRDGGPVEILMPQPAARKWRVCEQGTYDHPGVSLHGFQTGNGPFEKVWKDRLRMCDIDSSFLSASLVRKWVKRSFTATLCDKRGYNFADADRPSDLHDSPHAMTEILQVPARLTHITMWPVHNLFTEVSPHRRSRRPKQLDVLSLEGFSRHPQECLDFQTSGHSSTITPTSIIMPTFVIASKP